MADVEKLRRLYAEYMDLVGRRPSLASCLSHEAFEQEMRDWRRSISSVGTELMDSIPSLLCAVEEMKSIISDLEHAISKIDKLINIYRKYLKGEIDDEQAKVMLSEAIA